MSIYAVVSGRRARTHRLFRAETNQRKKFKEHLLMPPNAKSCPEGTLRVCVDKGQAGHMSKHRLQWPVLGAGKACGLIPLISSYTVSRQAALPSLCVMLVYVCVCVCVYLVCGALVWPHVPHPEGANKFLPSCNKATPASRWRWRVRWPLSSRCPLSRPYLF